MGCFLACFGSKKDRRRRKPAKRSPPRDQRNACYQLIHPSLSPIQESVEKNVSPVPESRGVLEEQVSLNSRKKVTFDLNVKTYEEVKVSINFEEAEKQQEKEKGENSEEDSVTASLGSYPSNHRYQNCSNSDDEYEVESDEDDEYDGLGDDDDDDFDVVNGRLDGEGESSESLFSLPSQKRGSATSLAENEVNSPIPASGPPAGELKTIPSNQNTRDRSQYVHSVLNPVENLSQWKAVKGKGTPPLKHQKENLNLEKEPQMLFSSEPTFKSSIFSVSKENYQDEPKKQEIAVDTSLSNWLGSSESTPSTKTVSNISIGVMSAEENKSQRSNSATSLEDRPILGALTVEELKQFSANSSPRKSPSRSPDDIPILGTVGRYWSHMGDPMDSSSGSSCRGIPNSTSKYREDKRVNWHSTPFGTRLERALNKCAAESS